MDLNSVVERAKNIIISPKEELKAILEENIDYKNSIYNYALPLILLSTFTAFFGSLGVSATASAKDALVATLIYFIVSLSSIYITAYLVNLISHKFKYPNDLNLYVKLIVYTSTPSYIASIISNISPIFSIVSFFGLYSLYLLWIGLDIFIGENQGSKTQFYIFFIVAIFFVKIALATIFIIIAKPEVIVV